MHNILHYKMNPQATVRNSLKAGATFDPLGAATFLEQEPATQCVHCAFSCSDRLHLINTDETIMRYHFDLQQHVCDLQPICLPHCLLSRGSQSINTQRVNWFLNVHQIISLRVDSETMESLELSDSWASACGQISNRVGQLRGRGIRRLSARIARGEV